MLGAGSINEAVDCAIVIVAVPLDNRAICIAANACVAKASPGDGAINVRPAILRIRRVNDAIAIAMVRLWQMAANRLDAMKVANVRANDLWRARNVTNVR